MPNFLSAPSTLPMAWMRPHKMPTILITGANRGLGFEFTQQYLRDGWHVIATCRVPTKATALQQLAAQNKNLQIETLEASDQNSIATLASKLENVALDILLNNAGIYSGVGKTRSDQENDSSQNFGTLDAVAWAKVLQTNTVAPLMVTQAFLPNIKRGQQNKIVFISSRMGSIERTNAPDAIAYRSSKAALNAAMRNISLSLQPEKITVVSFHPGWVQTDMGGAGADLTPEASITHIRQVIANLTMKQTGQFLNYDGGTIPW